MAGMGKSPSLADLSPVISIARRLPLTSAHSADFVAQSSSLEWIGGAVRCWVVGCAPMLQGALGGEGSVLCPLSLSEDGQYQS